MAVSFAETSRLVGGLGNVGVTNRQLSLPLGRAVHATNTHEIFTAQGVRILRVGGPHARLVLLFICF